MWNRYKDDSGADGDVPEGASADESVSSGSTRSPEIIIIDTRNKPPREFYTKESDAERLGYTRGCGGCNSWHRGLGRQPHNEACRARFKELMKDEARVQNAEERKKEFEEREVNKKRRKEEKKEEKKRKADDHSIEEDRIENRDEDMHVAVVKEEIANWVCEIGVAVLEQDAERKEEVEIEGHAEELSPGEIEEARGEEIEFLLNRKIWCEKPVQECWSKTGKAPVSVRWVDVRKGSGEVRSRLVARDFKAGEKGRDDLFAATPPLEGKRLLVSRAMTRRKDGKKRKLRFIDAKKAHLNPPCHEDVYIELPDEAGKPKGVCGKLSFWLYGFRKAASAWEDLYTAELLQAGFIRGRACGVLFYHPVRDLQCVVHGDDFTFCGLEKDLDWITGLIKTWFEIKVRATLGPDDDDDKEVVILGRTLRWKTWGIEWEADPKHRRIILEYFGFKEDQLDGLS